MVRKVNFNSSIISTLYGNGTTDYLYSPTCMFLHPSGSSLYVCDHGHNKIVKLDLNGNTVNFTSVIVGTGVYGKYLNNV